MKKMRSSIVFLLLSSSVFALPVDELNKKLIAFKSMSGDFTQVLRTDSGRVLQTADGKVYLSRPGKFRWEQHAPVKQLILINDKEVTIYDPELEQLSKRSMNSSVGVAPALLLSGDTSDLNALFNVTYIPSDDDTQSWFKLVSKDQDSITASIVICFEGKKIASMQVRDNLGHLTEIELSHVLLNSQLDKKLFEFTPPANVDVIYE